MAVSCTATPLFLIFLVVVFSCSYCIHAFHLPLRHNYPTIGHEKRKAWFSSVDLQKIGGQDRWRGTLTLSLPVLNPDSRTCPGTVVFISILDDKMT
jgi:hypothetical protein